MKRSLRKRALLAMLAGGLTAAMLPGVAAAGPPDRYEVNYLGLGLYGDLLALSNITRAELCTPFMVEFEQWILDGAIGEPPEGQFPEGEQPISIQEEVTGQGAIVSRHSASDLTLELWHLDDLANPTYQFCHDTEGQAGPWATGTWSQFQISGNDGSYHDPGSGTRGKEASAHGKALVTDADGVVYRFTVVEHYNDQCHVPDGELPACWIYTSTLRPTNQPG
jgi:hypothetical protein